MKLKDKVAGVTGLVRGLGWEMVQAFMQEGGKVVIYNLDQSGVDGEINGGRLRPMPPRHRLPLHA